MDFINYCNKLRLSTQNNFQKIKILDLDCNNGRIIISLNKHCKKDYFYLGLDINKFALKAGLKKIKPKLNSEMSPIYFDIDKTPLDQNIILTYKNNTKTTNLLKYDICLIDGTLHMFCNPISVLEEVNKFYNKIYIKRNKLEIPKGIIFSTYKCEGYD